MTPRHAADADGGFSLIELMIALAILAIIVAVALPSYRSYVLRSHRSDALATMTTYQTMLERCYAQTFAYDGTCVGVPASGVSTPSPQGFYTITVATTPTTYTLTAQATGTQIDDTACATMTLNQANERTPAGSCWNP